VSAVNIDPREPELLPEVSVVLPTHNEELLLANTVATITTELARRGLHYEIIVVENGSTDATPAIAKELADEMPELRVVVHQVGDYGEALYLGIRAARAPVITTFDVDLFDFGFFDLALSSLRNNHADIVIASKRAKGARDRRPPIRRVLTFGFMIMLRVLVDLRVTDAHGMKLLQGPVANSTAERCVMRGSLFDVELVIRATKMGARIVEIPVSVRELRPPRTGIVQRTLESLIGAIRLRSILKAEQ